MTPHDRITLAAAQIAGALIAAIPQRDRDEAAIRQAAASAVHVAKAIEEAVAASLKFVEPPEPPPRPSVPVGKV